MLLCERFSTLLSTEVASSRVSHPENSLRHESVLCKPRPKIQKTLSQFWALPLFCMAHHHSTFCRSVRCWQLKDSPVTNIHTWLACSQHIIAVPGSRTTKKVTRLSCDSKQGHENGQVRTCRRILPVSLLYICRWSCLRYDSPTNGSVRHWEENLDSGLRKLPMFTRPDSVGCDWLKILTETNHRDSFWWCCMILMILCWKIARDHRRLQGAIGDHIVQSPVIPSVCVWWFSGVSVPGALLSSRGGGMVVQLQCPLQYHLYHDNFW